MLWSESINANGYKSARLSRPDNCLLSAPHLCLLLLALFPLLRSLSLSPLSLSGKSVMLESCQ